MIVLYSPAVRAQAPGLGEVLVTASRSEARFWQKDRPVVGLRRQADGMVMNLTITSDTRDGETRKREIHTALLAAIDRAGASGFHLVSGTVQLDAVTKANYRDLAMTYAGRVDTSKVDLMVRTRLEDSAFDTQRKLSAFIASLKGNGRATVETNYTTALSIDNPDQYREAIVKLVAEDARRAAALVGPEFTFNLSGIDLQVMWTQASATEVFLYVPYRYSISPK
jgi:hypothetical protein